MKKKSKTQINLENLNPTINEIVYNNITFKVNDVITWHGIVGFWRIVGFVNNEEVLIKNIITRDYTKGSGNVERINSFMITSTVTKVDIIAWLEQCISVVDECF